MCDIGSGITDIAIHLAHHTNVLIAVEKGVFLVACTGPATTMRRLVSLETSIGEDNDESLGVFVGGRDRNVLFSYELRERWRG